VRRAFLGGIEDAGRAPKQSRLPQWKATHAPSPLKVKRPHSTTKSGTRLAENLKRHECNYDQKNDRLLHAVLCAYAKHRLDCYDIGWNQLGDILHAAICNEIGDEAYIEWGDRVKERIR